MCYRPVRSAAARDGPRLLAGGVSGSSFAGGAAEGDNLLAGQRAVGAGRQVAQTNGADGDAGAEQGRVLPGGPPALGTKLHKLAGSLVVVVDEQEVLIASSQPNYTATVTTNDNMVQIGRQFVWMELFAHRIFAQLGPSALAALASSEAASMQ